MDGTQWLSDVLLDNCGQGVMREPLHCHGATSKSGFPTIQASSCAQHSSNVVELPGTAVCLPSDHMVQIHNGCLSNKKTQPTTPSSLTDSPVLFLVEETFSPSTVMIAFWFQHHTHKPMSHLLLCCSEESFHYHLHWQAVPD